MRGKFSKKFLEHIEQYVKSERMGHSLKVEDISTADMAIITREIFEFTQACGNQDHAYREIFAAYGIMCPHPQNKRIYESKFKTKYSTGDYMWYDCLACGCAVINEHWLKIKIDREKAVAGE